MITEINGRWTCTKCGYEWSAMMGDNEVPTKCECENEDEDDIAQLAQLTQQKRRLIIDRITYLKSLVWDDFIMQWVGDLYDELEKIDSRA